MEGGELREGGGGCHRIREGNGGRRTERGGWGVSQE